jgi:hypothetical protein
MTIQSFRQLTGIKQAEVLWEHGVFIGERQSYHHTIMLYQVDAFYIEVLYHKKNGSIELRCFETTSLLQPYLEQINLAGIL